MIKWTLCTRRLFVLLLLCKCACLCARFVELFIHKNSIGIVLAPNYCNWLNGDVSSRLIVVGPVRFTVYFCIFFFLSEIFHTIYVTWCDVLQYVAHTLSASFLLFNCLTFKFSTVQIVLCTHIRTPTFCVRFFHSIWLFREHFECFLVNFVSFLLLYPRICSRNLRKEWNFMRFVYRWWFFSLISLINTVMFHKTMNVHSRNAMPSNLKSIKKFYRRHQDIISVMKMFDLYFLLMLRVAHTSKFKSFDILSMCMLWRRIFISPAFTARCTAQQSHNLYKHTKWSWTRCTSMWRSTRWRTHISRGICIGYTQAWIMCKHTQFNLF